jgi:hypothetical protein
MYYIVTWWDAEDNKWISDGIDYTTGKLAIKAARKFKRKSPKLTFRVLLNTKLVYMIEEL